MKKRNILLSLLFMLTMIISACGGDATSFEGQWKGTLDVTQQFEDGIKVNYPELEEYVDLESLVFVIDVTFDNGEMSMSVDQGSIDAFMANFESGMQKLGTDMLLAFLETQDMTLEEVVAESGMDEDAYLESKFKEMKIDQMAEAMQEVTNASMEMLSKIKVSYTFDEEFITLHYEDNTYEEIQYVLDGDELTLTVSAESFSLKIECEKQ